MGDSTDYALNDLIAAQGAARTAFFNGRLLSAEDLQREQALRAQGDARLARAIGCGIVKGLQVGFTTGGARLQVSEGMGITPSGEVIEVGNLDVTLTATGGSTRSGGFALCQGALTDLRAPGEGLYLLVLTPAWRPSGRASTLLGEVGACNRNVELPSVRMRLVPILRLDGNPPAVEVRNRIAHALLGGGGTRVGWLPADRFTGGLGADDLPLAVVRLDAAARIDFADGPAAQRPLAPPPGGAGDLPWPHSAAVEMKAFGRQFAAQLVELCRAGAAATDWAGLAKHFAFLPPAAVLDTEGQPVLAKLIGALKPSTLRRGEFVQLMQAQHHELPVPAKNEVPRVFRCTGSTLVLMVFGASQAAKDRPAADPSRAAGEFSSPRTASTAAKTLRRKDASATERQLAGSVLTQARNRKRG